MKCPFCSQENTRVIDSRPADDNCSIRRRRLCDACGKRFTTYEKIETIPDEDIVFALDAIQSPVSLYEPVYTEGGDTLYVMDQISDRKNREELWIEELSLNEAMKKLPERENYIISLRFFEGKTQMEVAEEIGISQAQVSRLEKNALKSMRNYLKLG